MSDSRPLLPLRPGLSFPLLLLVFPPFFFRPTLLVAASLSLT